MPILHLYRPAIVCGFTWFLWTASAHAHFLWVKAIEDEGRTHAFLYFGENVKDEAYHLPDALTDAKIWHRNLSGQRDELAVRPWEGEDRIGLSAPLTGDTPGVLEAQEQYGVYGTALLVYSAKHVRAVSADQLNAVGASKDLKLDIVPRVDGDRLDITVLWEGKPLAEAPVSLIAGDADAVEKKTDKEGRATFEPAATGTIGLLANRMDRDSAGNFGGKPYNHGLRYASLTLEWPVPAAKTSNGPEADQNTNVVPPLPEAVSSFGGVVHHGWLYVYGGHIGAEHDHSAANLSRSFLRIRLGGGTSWESLPMQTPLQGLALVAHGDKIYRVGGLSARNLNVETDEDLHSTAEFAEYDPESRLWAALPPLPNPRSSHNAVVLGDRLYVFGGWQLAGKPPGDWQSEALVYDFAEQQAGWQTLPAPPFKRRALAASHWQDKLVALGGMGDDGKISRRVDFFDPRTGSWSQGPDLPGHGMAGFGISACNLDGELYVSGIQSTVFRLGDNGTRWEEAARMVTGRFFHQLLPTSDGSLIAVGGASEDGHLTSIETIPVRRPAAE